jgi:hypothetical protein
VQTWRRGARKGPTQRRAASWLGVARSTVAKAELAKDKPLGELLDRALRAVMRG